MNTNFFSENFFVFRFLYVCLYVFPSCLPWVLFLHRRSLEPLQGLSPEGLCELVWAAARESAFLAGFQGKLLLLVWGSPGGPVLYPFGGSFLLSFLGALPPDHPLDSLTLEVVFDGLPPCVP